MLELEGECKFSRRNITVIKECSYIGFALLVPTLVGWIEGDSVCLRKGGGQEHICFIVVMFSFQLPQITHFVNFRSHSLTLTG